MNAEDRQRAQKLAAVYATEALTSNDPDDRFLQTPQVVLSEYVQGYEEALQATESENERLRESLAAYRSALLSGEPESVTLRRMAREALADTGTRRDEER